MPDPQMPVARPALLPGASAPNSLWLLETDSPFLTHRGSQSTSVVNLHRPVVHGTCKPHRTTLPFGAEGPRS